MFLLHSHPPWPLLHLSGTGSHCGFLTLASALPSVVTGVSNIDRDPHCDEGMDPALGKSSGMMAPKPQVAALVAMIGMVTQPHYHGILS